VWAPRFRVARTKVAKLLLPLLRLRAHRVVPQLNCEFYKVDTSHVLEFWGKARPSENAEHSWHPVAYHLLDVAASADALLSMRPVTRARAASLLGLPQDDAHNLLVAMIALHDIGKFAPQFQLLATPGDWRWPTVLEGVDATRLERSVHTADGLHLWNRGVDPISRTQSLCCLRHPTELLFVLLWTQTL